MKEPWIAHELSSCVWSGGLSKCGPFRNLFDGPVAYKLRVSAEERVIDGVALTERHVARFVPSERIDA